MLTPLLALLLAAPADVPVIVVVQPPTIEIRQHRHPHALQVLGTTVDGYTLDLRDGATITSADPKIARIDQGWVRPVASGTTAVTVAVAGKIFTVPVTVKLPAEEAPISFRHEVMAMLTRTGCNQGGCHGYSLGKNGFKLSLRGEDPTPD